VNIIAGVDASNNKVTVLMQEGNTLTLDNHEAKIRGAVKFGRGFLIHTCISLDEEREYRLECNATTLRLAES
jgi:hypothetical protein